MHRNRPDTTRFAGARLFEGCTPRQLTPVAPHADRIRVPAGGVIAEAGRSARELMVVLRGVTRVETPAGHLGCMVPGEAIAPHAVAEHGELPVTVTAVTDVELLVVNGPAFRWAVRELRTVAQRLGATPIAVPHTAPIAVPHTTPIAVPARAARAIERAFAA